ncbi:MAG TPA: alpha/beta fold hydrolase [Thermomicrobiales bacterium]|nr:alpha/beta fold hydrolase [Thermomicrobiales bacterium]
MQIETKYAKSGDASVAYQVIGQGPIDIVLVPCWLTNIAHNWREPRFAAFLERLGSFARLITFDKRGTGLSDPAPSSEPFTLEQRMDDLTAVLDAAGSKRAVLFGVAIGGRMAALYAATYPERVQGLILMETSARGSWAPDYPWGPTSEQLQWRNDQIFETWGGPVWIESYAPSIQHDSRFRAWWAECLRSSAGPAMAASIFRLSAESDIRSVLPSIQAPTLVMHRRGDVVAGLEEGRYLAGHIHGARFVELDGEDHLAYVGDQEPIFREISRFLAAELNTAPVRRSLGTVVSVNATGIAEFVKRAGAERWAATRASVRNDIETALRQYRGLASMQQGHGLVAAFDGPTRAINFACEVLETIRRHGLHAQIGLHAGMIEYAEDRIGGVTAELATRIAMAAVRDEILTSSTLVGLVTGSCLCFAPVEDREIVGLPAGLRLFAVTDGPASTEQTIMPRTDEAVAELSPREREVAFNVAQGMSNRAVGEALSISISTVERHVANILMKLGFRSRTQLSLWAAEQRLAVGD